MTRYLFLLYGAGSYLFFLATYAVMACFVANFFLSKTIDTANSDSLGQAMAINLLLMLLFGVQHSLMARPAFKRLWTKIVPPSIERSTYVLLSCLVILLLMWQWRGIDLVIWDVSHPAIRQVLWGLFVLGWLMVPLVSLMIDHFDLFGIRHVWLYFQGREYQASPFRMPMLYGSMRHPLYVGWTIAFWATPTMTLGHLMLAIVFTGYMWLAVIWEERDLIAHFGQVYEDYQERVPMFWLPWNQKTGKTPLSNSDAETDVPTSVHDSFHA